MADKRKKKSIPVYRCKFVECSDLFNGHRPLFDEMTGGDCPFTWGDNNRSMITLERLLNHLVDICHDYPVARFVKFEARCKKMDPQTYVDLEN